MPLVLATVIHECGHAAVMAYFDGRSAVPRFGIFKFLFPHRRERGYLDEGMIYLGGIFFNIAFCVCAIPFLYIQRTHAGAFVAANLMTAISNLVPMRGSDGYGALRVLLDFTGAGRVWYEVLRWVSFLSITAGVTVALYLMARVGEGYWIYGSCMAMMIGEMGEGGAE